MERDLEHILTRLESAVDDWSEQVSSAQQDMADRLAKAKGRINDRPELADEAADQRAALETLRGALSESCEATRAAVKRIEPVESAVESLRAEVRALDGVIRELTGREDQLNQRIDELTDEILRIRQELRAKPAASAAGSAAPSQAPVPETHEETEPAFEAYDEDGARRRAGEILIHAGLITIGQLQAALDLQAESPHRRLGSILVEQGFAGEEDIARMLSAQLQIPFMSLARTNFEPDALRLVPARLAAQHMAVPLRLEAGSLLVAMANPLDLVAVDDIELASAHRVRTVVAMESEVAEAVASCYANAPTPRNSDA